MPTTPDRLTISIPPDDELDEDVVDRLVESGGYASRSELIRELIRDEADVLDPD